MLFTGDEVTGLLDFGAADIDSPAGDVGRLLGSLVGDDRDAWQRGLDAYQTVRPLSADELAAARLFDSSGVVLSALNWVGWLWGRRGEAVVSDRAAAIERLRRLVERLRVLADGASR